MVLEASGHQSDTADRGRMRPENRSSGFVLRSVGILFALLTWESSWRMPVWILR